MQDINEFMNNRQGELDTNEGIDLYLSALHDGNLYRSQLELLHKAVEKHFKKGEFNFMQAMKAYKNVLDYYAKFMQRQHPDYNYKFSSITRWYAAKELTEIQYAEMKLGNFHNG